MAATNRKIQHSIAKDRHEMQVKKEINQLEWEKRKLENITRIKGRRKKG